MTKEAMTRAREALHKELLHEAEQIIDFLIKRLPVSDDRNAEIAAFTFWKLKMRGDKPWMEPLDALATAALAQPSDEARDAALRELECPPDPTWVDAQLAIDAFDAWWKERAWGQRDAALNAWKACWAYWLKHAALQAKDGAR